MIELRHVRFGSKADIAWCGLDVRLGPNADIAQVAIALVDPRAAKRRVKAKVSCKIRHACLSGRRCYETFSAGLLGGLHASRCGF